MVSLVSKRRRITMRGDHVRFFPRGLGRRRAAMQLITENLGLLWEALFLKPEPYAYMRDRESPAVKGLVLLIVLGLALALAALIGGILTWATSPDLNAIKDVVFTNLQRMEWWQMMASQPQAMEGFQQTWDTVWSVVGAMLPSPASGLAGFLVRPLTLVTSWFIFGVVAHLLALLFGGNGRFGQTLGATSLAAAPQLLGLLMTLPYVALAGIGVWTLLARYMAIRVSHDLSWARAMWVTVLTGVVIALLLGLLFGAGMAAFGATMAAAMSGGQ
jgi:hypothetical protein